MDGSFYIKSYKNLQSRTVRYTPKIYGLSLTTSYVPVVQSPRQVHWEYLYAVQVSAVTAKVHWVTDWSESGPVAAKRSQIVAASLGSGGDHS